MRSWRTTALVIAALVYSEAAIGASDVDLLKGRTWLCSGGETFSLGAFGKQPGPVYTPDDPIVLTFNDDPDADGFRTYNFSNRSQGLIFGKWKPGKGGKTVLQLDPGFIDVAYVPFLRTMVRDILADSKAVKRIAGTVAIEDVTATSAAFRPNLTLTVSDSLALKSSVRNTLKYSATIRNAEGKVVRRLRNARMLEKGTYRGSSPQ